jgi:hypothetical protein
MQEAKKFSLSNAFDQVINLRQQSDYDFIGPGKGGEIVLKTGKEASDQLLKDMGFRVLQVLDHIVRGK